MPARAKLIPPIAGALILGAAPVMAQPAAPPAYPPFPAARTLQALSDWVRRNTDLPPARVVGVAADSLFAIEPVRDQPAPPVVRTIIRQEAINPEFARRLGGRSASMSADIDCRGRRVFQRRVDLYAGSNRQGAARPLGAAGDWQAIPAGTFMERVMIAVCDPDWRGMFASGVQPAPARPTPAAPVYAPPPPPPQPYAAPSAAYEPPRYAPAPPPRYDAPGQPGRAEIGRYPTSDGAVDALGRVAGLAPPSTGLKVELAGSVYRALVDGFYSRADTEAFCRAVQGCRVVE